MSKNLSALQTFAYSVERCGGRRRKETQRISRRMIVRRPSAPTFTTTGDRDGQAWYEGKQITFISNRAKVWARGPMPGTLDEASDFLAAECDVRMPAADLLYSNPYEALMTSDTTGGWVDVQHRRAPPDYLA